MMKPHFVFTLALSASPIWLAEATCAQEWTPPQADAPSDGGAGLLDGIMGNVFNNLMNEIGPDLGQVEDGMTGIARKLGPAMADLAAQIDDLRYYQMPERLENGDIILRRKADAPPPPPLNSTPGEEGDPTSPVDPDAPEIEL
ncbi:AAA+ family ATPase [Paracoccus fistulariae]|nr:AAA+ family ATPase [Paracoccus fistulariae]MDB6181595.1 AAA+ family ATPase [Paracoccus fistulariae]